MHSTHFFNALKQHYENKLPFVVYRKPYATTILALLQENDTLFFTKNYTEKGFVFAPFNSDLNSVLMPISACSIVQCEIDFKEEARNQMQSVKTQNGKEKHIALVEKALFEIDKNTFKKVVLSREEVVQVNNLNIFSIFKNIVQSYPNAFAYCWYHPQVGLWFGGTPETLFKLNQNSITIMALAGTQIFNGNSTINWEQKEKDEQHIVTQYIVENISNLATQFNVSPQLTVKAGHLLHLQTKITAEINSEVSLKNIITKLHPTPAVCGYPKEEAKAFILKNETYHRNFYTGFLGEINVDVQYPEKDITELYVNLRCMQYQNNNLSIYVGGGITNHSNPEQEWEETIAKALVMKKVI